MRVIIFFISILFLGSCQSPNEKLIELLTSKKCSNWGIIIRERESGISKYNTPIYSYMLCNDGHYTGFKYNTDTKIWEELKGGDVITSNRWKMLSDSIVEIGDFEEWKINKITSDTLIWSAVKNPKLKEIMIMVK